MGIIHVEESYTPCGVNVGKIVNRIVKYAPQESIEGLKRIMLVDANPKIVAFGSYWSESSQIELYVQHIIGDLPWLLRKSYVIPYLFIGLALGHEIDHHVNREAKSLDKERHAETHSMKYVYPSFGIFKPLYRLLVLVHRLLGFPRSSSASCGSS